MLFEGAEGEGLVHKEWKKRQPIVSRESRGPFFLEADLWVFKSNGVPNCRKEEDGQANEEGRAGQRFRGFHLRPNEFESEASSFGIADLLLNPHAAIIEGSQGSSRSCHHQGSRWPLAHLPTTRMEMAPSERRSTVPRSRAWPGCKPHGERSPLPCFVSTVI